MRGHAPYWIDPSDQNLAFPDVGLALRQPDGLLAIGGDLSPARLTAAYRRGIFPWYNDDQPILWWSPDPRAVIFPDAFHLSRSLRKTLRQQIYTVTIDQAFAETISACAAPRTRQDGTWITDEMRNAYIRLHELKLAHSVECWQEGELVGGIYGISLGRVFFGESMFSRRSNASKVAIAYLVAQLQRWDFGLLDCQIASAHLGTLGAVSIARPRFLQLLHEYCDRPAPPMPWHFDLPPDWWQQ